MKSIAIRHDAVKVCEERIVIDVDEGHRLDISLLLDEQELAPLFCGAAWAGTLVWEAAELISNYVLNELDVRTLRVVELGAGLGVPGMVAGILGAPHVVLTEQPELVPLLRTNIRRNFSASNVEAAVLSWGTEATTAFCARYGAFDLVLCCDCIYEPLYGQSWRALALSMDVLCAANPACRVLVSVERRHGDGIDAFLAFLPDATSLSATLHRRVPKPTKALCDEGDVLEIYLIQHRPAPSHMIS
ncbi:hypothetical protein SPRG_06577 [Saprolegnia parasitica CBS 223.65]|uniref:Uncharacterized protein n=1 Tax=Saprolegnia parasitica (strain CBS 223.65) TaxID=695850 RepID=A0A067CCX4_SAPPC|nr:hypothetical protein SPRG_06577 [Saprolegnia parasitica CBS 223.65]KDO28338.1 hypothetical protein SPRG_06577 [Saprolegnia parasitica CBS 223.65]|eukprot:XP_012200786.1 hypothetical protein SPRG_06577 [Saprolegnia parasitica CBS 223.65]